MSEARVAQPPDPTRMLDALTGIRAFAALWVVSYHFKAHMNALLPITKWIDPLISSGYLGVDLFFCLSGFILAYRYLHWFGPGLKRADYGRFLWLRLARVWPVQLFTLNAFVLMLTVGHLAGVQVDPVGADTSPRAYLENIFLVHAWFGENLSFNFPAWSVSAEWFAYLLFPLLAPVIVRFRSIAASAAAAGVCYAVLIASWLLRWHSQGATGNALLRVTLQFLAGCFLFMIWEQARQSRWWGIGAFVALTAIIAGTWTFGSGLQGVVLAPLFGLIILCLASGRGAIARCLSTRAAVFGGEISYALYMTHGMVLPVANRLFPPEGLAERGLAVRLAVGLLLVAMIAVPAVATHLLVEKPARRYLRGKLKTRASSGGQDPGHQT